MPTDKLNEVMLTIRRDRTHTYRIPLPEDGAPLTVTSILALAKDAMYISDLETFQHPAWTTHLNGLPVQSDLERKLSPGDCVLWEHTKA